MPADVQFITTRDESGKGQVENRVELFQELSSVGSTDAIRLQGAVTVQISGSATDIVGRVERASRDPNGAQANWAPAEDTDFTGDLSAGISARAYNEPATGFWRFRITSLTGGTCKVSIVGERT